MKKIVALFLALTLCVGLAACSGSSSASGNSQAGEAASGPIKVDVFWYTYSDTYLTNVRNAMEESLAGMADAITYTMHDCENDQAKQTQKIDTALTQGTDLLIVNIVTTGSEEAAQAIVDKAKEAGVPILFFNREVSDAVVNSYEKCAFVGTDADEAGYMQGEMIAAYLLAEENWTDGASRFDLDKDGKIDYIMFRGEHGNAEAFGRTKYSVEEANRLLAESGKGLTLVPSPANTTSTQYEDDGISNYFLYGNWSSAEAANLMRTALSSFTLASGDIELIIANNDDQALGAIEAMNEEGYNTGAEDAAGYIPTFGVDATPVAVEAITSGAMTGTIKQDAQGMSDCILYLAGNIAAGKEIMAETDAYNIDEGVSKIRIPYAIVT